MDRCVAVGFGDSGNSRDANMEMMMASIDDAFELVDYDDVFDFSVLPGARMILCIEVSKSGVNMDFERFLQGLGDYLEEQGTDLSSSLGAILISSRSENYTKSYARSAIFRLNGFGLPFIGLSVVEATVSLSNLARWSEVMKTSRVEILAGLSASLSHRMLTHSPPSGDNSGNGVLAIHASSRKTSNTLMYWDEVRRTLMTEHSLTVDEVSLHGLKVYDCNGCDFSSCASFGKMGICFHDDEITRQAYGLIKSHSRIVLLCPNYNDSASGRIIALINRLTVLYRSESLYGKSLYAIVVSGNSGGNCVAEQLAGALNVNKGLYLPPYFSALETASTPLSICNNDNFRESARLFAQKISSKT